MDQLRRGGKTGRRARARAWLALGLVAALAGCATTGSVQGKVTVSDPRAGSSKDAVIVATPMNGPDTPLGTGQAEIVMTGGQFTPRTLLVEPGTTVRFTNRDAVYHNAFSRSSGNRFDLGSVAPGQARGVRFTRPGLVEVYCELHPREVAHIVVAPRRTSTRPLDNGTYLLAGLAPGPYAVRAWHPLLGSQTRRIDLPPRGRLTVDFHY
ncbi:MAG: hypothetical protein ABI960_01335 [Candidatus Eisenbacteria bacterium]